MVERKRNAHTVLLRHSQPVSGESRVVQQVAVRQQDALGTPGRTRCVLDVNGIVRQHGLVRKFLPLSSIPSHSLLPMTVRASRCSGERAAFEMSWSVARSSFCRR